MGKHFSFSEIASNFLLLILFCGALLAVVLSGTKIYQGISANLDKQFSTTTCLNYITAKVRHYDANGGVTVEKFGNGNALVLTEDINGEVYATYLYCYEDSLMELFCSMDSDFDETYGEKVMAMDNVEFSLKNNILSFSCEKNGDISSSIICIHSLGGAK